MMRAVASLRALLLALLATLALAVPAAAQTFPTLTGRVVDAAGILDPSTRAALVAKLAALEAQTSDQLVVATVPSLGGNAIEPYATQLFRAWRLGQAAKNNGVLLLVAPNERKVRIEVGYGLEGTLTDAISKLIIVQAIAPRFRAGDFAGGITQATDDIVQVLTGDAPAWQRRAAASAPPQAHVVDVTHPHSLGDVLIIALCLLMVLAVVGPFAFVFLAFLVKFLVWLGLLPKQKDRHGAWLWLDFFNGERQPARARARRSSRSSSSWSWSSSSGSSSSSSSDSFSGGGGSSGGGGASGSW
jgi:uncharacterized protein